MNIYHNRSAAVSRRAHQDPHPTDLHRTADRGPGGSKLAGCSLYIDAGIRNIRLRAADRHNTTVEDSVVPSETDIQALVTTQLGRCDFGHAGSARIYITGKLGATVRQNLGTGKVIMSTAAYWLAALKLIKQPANGKIDALAMINLSASGYLLIGINRSGTLEQDLLTVNPRCGAGSGVNLDRVLQKLAIQRGQVDELLAEFLGEEGSAKRANILIRTDRCGVFASSATISDKNQGIPLDIALATTLKSEVYKACSRLPTGFQKVYLCGRIFQWRFARNCAEDILQQSGVHEIEHDIENGHLLEAMHGLVERIGPDNIAQPDIRLQRGTPVSEYPSFAVVRNRHQHNGHYLRLDDPGIHTHPARVKKGDPVNIGLDVGSTMAKAVVADAAGGQVLLQCTHSNAGDTIETIKQIFREIIDSGYERLAIKGIGITGSARYQVQQALHNIYPELASRISLLVENYAHARGSIDHVRQHIDRLKRQGQRDINEDFCILIDIGGEDTKISTIALKQAELFDNAMNLKCSAGTGSLMDTLSAMFNIDSVSTACNMAFNAQRALSINATCAVFLMENASRLQAQGVPREEILASANWAIVENMARTLWNQVELPPRCVVLLHGQTMLSEPLPLAVTQRLQEYLEAPVYALVPPSPGHRACFGLVDTLAHDTPAGHQLIELSTLIDTHFDKRMIVCKGAACGDNSARCNRCSMSCRSIDGKKTSFTLGGCSAINELLGRKSGGKKASKADPGRDTYREIWAHIDGQLPRSDDPDRLVIPRSFAVSEWAYFLSCIFSRLGIPVHVDNVLANDIVDAQPDFSVDSCAPLIGAVGQYRRLAAAPHGLILGVQIETLPTDGASRGLTCTTNQGGIATAGNLALTRHPGARLHYLHLDLDQLNADYLCDQLYPALAEVFKHYHLSPGVDQFSAIIQGAIDDHFKLREETADLAADLARQALQEGRQVALIVGREYILNPGIYDSHIQKLLHDKRMAAIPAYVLDIELDEEYRYLYWRNPHFIVSLLNAVSKRTLHQRMRNRRLAEIFRTIEQSCDLLPVIQISTFSCGPDSLTAHYIAAIMRQRPFLMIQSDAAIKELAHLENRVNTYIKQLESSLHEKLRIDGAEPVSLETLDQLSSNQLDRKTDVIFFPTLSDNRALTSVLRGAGFTCIDNYDDQTYDLHQLITEGRKTTGESVCAPLAGMYADLVRGIEEFARRKQAKDPALNGKKRLLYFDSQGTGPCRQGQYPGVHKLLYHQSLGNQPDNHGNGGCPTLPGGGIFQLLVPRENEGYNAGFDEWVLIRAYQGIILQGVLHDILFRGAGNCRDFQQYQDFIEDYRRFKSEIFRLLGAFTGPGKWGRWLIHASNRLIWPSYVIRYFVYRVHGREFKRVIRRFVRKWNIPSSPPVDVPRVLITGEGYMRVSQSEAIFNTLIAQLGFRRFDLRLTPLMTYLEYLLDEAQLNARTATASLRTRISRTEGKQRSGARKALHDKKTLGRKIGVMRYLLRHLLASPLYRAARQPLPMASSKMMKASKALLPTQYPRGELAPYLGEAVHELKHGIDVLLNVGPSGCMVASMGQVLTPSIMQSEGISSGRIQSLFSADGDVNEEQLMLAMLKAMGPVEFCQTRGVQTR